MDTDDESDNDSESVRDSHIEFMNEDESEEELSFYRRFENTVQPFNVLLFIVYRVYYCPTTPRNNRNKWQTFNFVQS